MILASARKLFAILLMVLLITPAIGQQSEKKSSQSWATTEKAGKGSITIFWNDAPPFIWKDTQGNLHGIEYELILGFQQYTKTVHHADLEIRWKEQKSFNAIYKRILAKEEWASFGASGISITNERQQEVGFSPSYMADITVMISSENVPIAKNIGEFMKVSKSLTAITVERSTFEQDLLKLKKAGDLSYAIHYVTSSNLILEEIQKRNDAFGIIDLAIYLDSFEKNPTTKVNRQNLFPKIRKGFGLIYPLGSDWGKPMAQYFHEKNFKGNFQKIISRYINLENYNFIESLTDDSGSQISLLTKEKEIQLAHLKEEIKTRNMWITLLAIAGISLVLIILLFRKSRQLIEKIEHQRKNIELQNRELEMKNKKLEEFTFANAHKLRAPVAAVLGLIQRFDSCRPDDVDQIMESLKQSSSELDSEVKAIRIKLEEEGWVHSQSNV